MLTLFTSIKSLSLGMKLLELAYKLNLILIGNDNCGEIVNQYELNLCAHRHYKIYLLMEHYFFSLTVTKKRTKYYIII